MQLLKYLLASRYPYYLVLAGLVTLIFLPAIDASFVWDDQFFVVQNRYLDSTSQVKNIFFTSINEGAGGAKTNFYRPLQLLSHFVDKQLYGNAPMGHHATNLIFQAILGILFFNLCVSFFTVENRRARLLSFLVSSLWVLHPLQGAAAAYVSGRGDILVGIFMIAGALVFNRSTFTALICCLLAMLSKENGIMAPIFILLCQWPRCKNLNWHKHLPNFILAGFYIVLRLTSLNFADTLNFYNAENILTQNWSYRLFTFLAAIYKGFGIIVWPFGIHHERSFSVMAQFAIPVVMGGAALLSICLSAAWFARKRWPIAAIGALWFVLATLPTSNLVALINALFYDHWFIFPSLGVALLLLQLLQKMQTRITLLVWMVLVIPINALSWQQAQVWKTGISLNEHILRFEPNNFKVLHNLGMYYAEANLDDLATLYYLRSAQIQETEQVRNNLGNLYLKSNDLKAAEQSFSRAIELNANLYQAHRGMGLVALRLNDCKRAQAAFTLALSNFDDPVSVQGLEVANRECAKPILPEAKVQSKRKKAKPSS
jgi:hypothetical protein